MALTVGLTGTTVTLDETAGLQNDDTNTALPSAFSSRLTALGADPATAINQAVSSGNVISISGATGTLGNLAFLDENGGALDGDSSGLFTNDGEEIFLFTDPTNDNIVLGKTALGAIAFAVYLEETGSPVSGAKFWTIQYEALEHLDPTNPDDSVDLGSKLKVGVSDAINFSFTGAPSGSNLFMTFGDPSSAQIVVIGKTPLNQSEGGNITTKDVLNISQAGSTTSFGVNGNQINPTEGAYITYVTGADTNFLVPNLDQNEADVEGNIAFKDVFETNSASFTVNQTNPGVGPVTVKITAFDTAAEPGVNFVDGLTGDTHVDITSFSIVDNVVKSGKLQFTPQASIDTDGNLIITGLSTGDKVTWTTSGTHDRVLIENISNADGISGNDNNTFDIGGFSLVKTNATSTVVGTAVHFEDDGPTVDLTLKSTAELRLDESVGADKNDTNADDETNAKATAGAIGFDTIAAVDLFTGTPDFGADGKAASDDTLFELTLATKVSGLTDTKSGEAVELTLVNGEIQGKTATGGELVLTIDVDKTTGDVTVNQFRAVVHDDAKDSDESGTSSESIDKDVVGLKVTVTDGDKDTANDSVDLGPIIKLEDDGPTVDLTLKGTAELRLDESVGADKNDTNADDETNAKATAGAIGFDTIAAVDLFTGTPDFGTDGKAASDDTLFELTLATKVSGLTDTASGQAVDLTLVNGVVQGKTTTSGDLVLTISVDKTTGDVTVNQFRAVVHDDTKDPDESGTSSDSISKDVVGLKVTVTDGDKDTANDSVDLGPIIKLEDDGPTIAIEDSKGDFTAGAQGTWDHDNGTDGFKSLTMTLHSYKIDGNTAVTVDAGLTSTVDKDGNFVFTGTIKDDFNGDKIADTVDFKLTMDPDNPETYDLQLTTPPGGTKTFDTSQGSLKSGGPDAVQTLDLPSTTGDIIFFATLPTAPFENGKVGSDPNDIEDLVSKDLTEAQLEALKASSLINASAQMNVSTAGIGVNNNNLDGFTVKGESPLIAGTSITSTDETFVINPADDVDTVKVFIDNSVGGYTPATEDLYYVTYFTDGSVSSPTKVVAADLHDALKGDPSVPKVAAGGKYFEIDGGSKDIEAVQLIMGKGTVKIPVIQFTIETEFNPSPIDMNFTADLFDGDKDDQQDSFSVHLDPVTV